MTVLRSLVAWLKATPTEKPKDLILFENSIERLRISGSKLDQQTDELSKLIHRMQAKRRTRKKVRV